MIDARTRVCTKCGIEKTLGEFSRDRSSRSGLHSQCQRCWALSARASRKGGSIAARRAAERALIAAAKDRPCKDCGQRFPSYVMDLDHLDPDKKRFRLGASDGRSLESIRAEIAKCEAVCANCHRIRTHLDPRVKSKSAKANATSGVSRRKYHDDPVRDTPVSTENGQAGNPDVHDPELSTLHGQDDAVDA